MPKEIPMDKAVTLLNKWIDAYRDYTLLANKTGAGALVNETQDFLDELKRQPIAEDIGSGFRIRECISARQFINQLEKLIDKHGDHPLLHETEDECTKSVHGIEFEPGPKWYFVLD
jgi:hypothetical protein